MKTFTATTCALLAITVAGILAVSEFALVMIGLIGLFTLWVDFSRVRRTKDTKLEVTAFSLASLAVIALLIQGVLAVGEVVMGFTGLIGFMSVCMDVTLLRDQRLEPTRAFGLPVLALAGMMLGGIFAVSEQALAFSGLIGLVALAFDATHQRPSIAEPQQMVSDLELIQRDVPRV